MIKEDPKHNRVSYLDMILTFKEYFTNEDNFRASECLMCHQTHVPPSSIKDLKGSFSKACSNEIEFFKDNKELHCRVCKTGKNFSQTANLVSHIRKHMV